MKKLVFTFLGFILLCSCFSSHDPVEPLLVFIHDTVWYAKYDTVNDTILKKDTFFIRDTVIEYIPYGHSGGKCE